MKASLYESMSNEQTTVILDNGKSIKKSLPHLDYENTIIIANGKLTNENYIVKEKDIIVIRLMPGAATTALAAGLITLAVVTVIGGVVGGVMIYKQKEAMAKAEKELEKMKKLSGKPELDNRPFLRGASNTLATGNSQPYIIGRHFFTPYLLCSPFYKIVGTDGENQYIYLILECGFNKQVFSSISIDDITIKNFTDTSPQQGVYPVESSLFAEDGILEISQDGALLASLPDLNYKVVSAAVNDEIVRDIDVEKHPESKKHLLYTLNPHAMNVDVAVSFPHGLYAVDDEGDKITTKVTITPQYSTDGGKTWTGFTFNNNGVLSNTFERLVSTKELRYVAHHDFSAQDYNNLKNNNQKAILIRICSNGNKDSYIKNDCYCLYYQSTCFDPNKTTSTQLVPCKVIEDRERSLCTIMGLRIKSSKANEEKLKKINIITQGVARVWDGSKWSIDKIPTQNPAAWALEILTSPIHPASRYDDSELDLESFGDFYEFCKENNYTFNWVITQNAKKDDVLAHIMDACGACLYNDIYGRRAIAIDKKQENALAVYNAQNIISIQNKKTFSRQTDALRIKYTNSKDDLFQEDTYIVMRKDNSSPSELSYDSIIKDVNVTGITEYTHIVKYARRLMAIEALRPKITTIEVGNEGVFYTPMAKVLIQDDSLKIGLANACISDCKWQGGLLKKIFLKQSIFIPDVNKLYGVIVNCFTENGGNPIALKVESEFEGNVKELIVVSSLSISAAAVPEQGNILSFGELDSDGDFTHITTPYIISNIKRNDKGFVLDLVNYHEAVYEAGAIPEYESNITRRQGTTPPPIPKDIGVTHEELQKAIAGIDGTKTAQEAADLIVHGVRFTDNHKIRDIDYSLQDIIKKIDEDAYNTGATIERTQEDILLKVEDNDEKTRAFIAITKKGILQQVEDNKKSLKSYIDIERDQILQKTEDMKRELTGLLAVQAGAVKAMVEGGGASGQLALSLELPAMIDKATHKKFFEKCGEAETAAVYARLAGTDYYAIKGNASSSAVKRLWDRAVKAALIASQIQLNADQIVVQNGDKTAAAFIDGKLRAACIDAENLIVQQLKIDSDKNSDQDFEAYFDKIRGLQIKNKGADILKIDPKTGEAFFTGKVQAGSVELADRGVFIRNGEISIENKGWKGVLRPCEKGVELAILGGDGGNMTKRQLWTYIAGGVLNLFVLGNITSCSGMYNASPDGTMKNKRSGTDKSLYSVAYGNGTWIAAGSRGTILKSTDNGNSWTIKNSGTDTFISGIFYGSNTWITVGEKGTILKSTDDGETWTIKDSDTDKQYQSVTYGNGRWIGIGFRGAIVDSIDNGDFWRKRVFKEDKGVHSVAYGNGAWIAVGEKGTILKSTDDSETWTIKDSGTDKHFHSVAYGSNTWIAVGTKGEILKSTDDGETWTKKNSGTDKIFLFVAYGNGAWIAVGYYNVIFKSTDNGETWTKLNSGTDGILNGIATDGVTFVAVGNNGTILSSTDAVQWE